MNVLGQNLKIVHSSDNIIPRKDSKKSYPSRIIIPWIKYKNKWYPIYENLSELVDRIYSCQTVEELDKVIADTSKVIVYRYQYMLHRGEKQLFCYPNTITYDINTGFSINLDEVEGYGHLFDRYIPETIESIIQNLPASEYESIPVNIKVELL